MNRVVPDDGHEAATFMVIGEAPGKDEMAMGYPFAGASGQKLRSWFNKVGLKRSDAYVTNILGEMPPAPNGDIDAALKSKALYPDDIRAGFDYVQDVAERLPNLSVICPVGNYAAYPFTPGGRLQYDTNRPGITSIRGSCYPYTLSGGRTVTVVPTIHPAAVLRRPVWEKRCIHDWSRIASLIGQPYQPPPKRNHIINPTLHQIEDWVDQVRPGVDIVGLDIETWGDRIQCVGLGISPYESITIPTISSYWNDGYVWQTACEAIKYIVEHPSIELCMQNGLFDSWWLTHEGYHVRGFVWDTLGMHHAIDPIDQHSLDYMASIHTRQPYWKDEAKSADEIVKIANDVGMDRLYVYNGLDVTVMYELMMIFQHQLTEMGLMDFYFRHYADMHDVLLGMMRRGVGCDRDMMLRQWRQHMMEARRLRDRASALAGRPLYKFDTTKCEQDMLKRYQIDEAWVSDEEWQRLDSHIKAATKAYLLTKGHKVKQIESKWDTLAKKQVSDMILGELLYETWNAPKGPKTPTGRFKVDEVQLKATAIRAKERVRLARKDDIIDMVGLVLDHRRHAKLGSFLTVERLDSDDRMRCEYRFATRSGRLASRENPRGTGSNLQNYDRDLLSIFIPRPGHIFVEVDLSQAESRVVKVCTGDRTMIETARLHPAEYDEHRQNAVIIFSTIEGRDLLPQEITYEQRQLGKRVVHASNYNMGANELSRTILKETGEAMTRKECEEMLLAYRTALPQIGLYQSKVRKAVMAFERLYTSWGRTVDLRDMRKDDELYKFCYSYIPQSEIGDLTNQRGLIPLQRYIDKHQMDAEIVGQKHDSILVDCLPEEAWYVMNLLDKWLSQERIYGRALGHEVALSIPCEFAVGHTGKMAHAWKRLPDRGVVLEICNKLLEKIAA